MTPIVANFHGLGEPPIAIDADERPYWLTVTQYEGALAQLRASGQRFVVTFDDGNLSDLTIGLPRLAGETATVFVCSARIGARGYCDAAALREMSAMPGVEIGSHGHDHVPWTKASGAQRVQELSGSRTLIEDAVQAPVRAAGIPFGAYDRSVLRDVAGAGYEAAYSSDGGPRLSATGVVPRLSLRGDRDIGEQVAALVESAGMTGRIRQEARLRAKAILKR